MSLDASKREKKIRKLQFDKDFLLMFGGIPGKDAKIIVKDLKEKGEHYTMQIYRNLSFDVHKTKEGKPEEKIHDILEVGKLKISSDILAREISRILSECKINVDDSTYTDFTVLIPKSKEAFVELRNKIFRPQKDRMVCLMEDIEKELPKHFYVAQMNEVTKYDFDWAIVIDPNKEPEGALIKKNNEFFLITIAEEERLVKKLIETH